MDGGGGEQRSFEKDCGVAAVESDCAQTKKFHSMIAYTDPDTLRKARTQEVRQNFRASTVVEMYNAKAWRILELFFRHFV